MANAGDNNPLRSMVDRIVRLEQQRKELAEDIKEILQEGKSAGIKAKALKRQVREEMMTEEQRIRREEDEEEFQTLQARLGILADTELGEAAVARARS